MTLIKTYIPILLLTLMSLSSLSQEIWTIGPMVHLNFGGEKKRMSYSLEFAYWNLDHFYYSVDGGIEFEQKKIRIYSEIQTGIGVTGISCGPLLEINKQDRQAHIGFQTTAWLNYFIGADFRKRWVNKTRYNCVGMYAKIPVAASGLSSSNSNSSNNSSHHHWNWD